MKHIKSKPKRTIITKINNIQRITKAISKKFIRKGQLDINIVHKNYKECVIIDNRRGNATKNTNHRYNHYDYGYSNPIFTSRNSHKQTNKK
jgi:hypothetical protein